jgi:hypothetical protein
MPTNQTSVTTTVQTTYVLPISFSALTMADGIGMQEQLLVFRPNIDSIYGSSLTIEDYRGLGQIASSWLTINTTTRQITGISIPPSATYTLSTGATVAYPALVAAEPLIVLRSVVSSEPYVDWVTGSRITADQLNLNTSQLLAVSQELKNSLSDKIGRDDFDAIVNPLAEDLNCNTKKLTNVATPTSASDAATKAYVDDAINTAVTSKLGQANGIATLDSSSLLTTSQRPSSTSVLPGSFFSKATAPVRTTGGDGLYKHGSIWFNTSTGRLFVYIPDDRYTGLLDTHNGDIGYWVDVSSPAL